MKKSKTKILLGASTVLALLGSDKNAVAATTANIVIQARIVASSLLVTGTTKLDFGAWFVGDTGTVKVKVDGSTVITGTLTLAGGTPQAGGLKVRGDSSLDVVFTVPASQTIKNTGGDTMVVNNFKMGAGSSTANGFTMSLTGGFQSGIPLGGTLTIPPAQPAGSYSGTLTITANYN